jgi:hypothetical protein
MSGVQTVDGVSLRNRTEAKYQGPVMVRGKPTTIVCKVRKQELGVTANDRPLFQYEGDFRRIAGPAKDWDVPTPQVFVLGTWQCSYQFSAVEITPVSGPGKILD